MFWSHFRNETKSQETMFNNLFNGADANNVYKEFNIKKNKTNQHRFNTQETRTRLRKFQHVQRTQFPASQTYLSQYLSESNNNKC
jgi:hypothetical protein